MSGRRVTITLPAEDHGDLLVAVAVYREAVAADGEANEAAQRIADLLVDMEQRGDLRGRRQ